MKILKRPKLENLDHHKCGPSCWDREWPCHCQKGYGKAYRNNVAVNQATKLKALDKIQEVSYGVWLVCNRWYFHPNSKLARLKGQKSRYQKFKNFTTFWKHIHQIPKPNEPKEATK